MSAWLHIITNPIYLAVCLIVGFAGRERRTGFFGWFIFSVLLTPLLMLFVLYVGGEKKKPRLEDDDEPLAKPAR